MKETLRAALDDRGYTTLTPVQEAVIAPELTGCDLLVSAQTGSGKTLGFGLAIAPTILGEADRFDGAAAPLALIIAPTRELALQVKRELAWLYAKAGAVVTSCVGGMDMRDERRALARGAHIVVATPGRLRDHIMRASIDLSTLRAVVLDEADEMLDLGFREDLEFILGESPESRQTLMFSATVPKMIATLAKSYQKDAIRVATKSEDKQHADIEYKAMMVAPGDADNAVINTLRYFEAPNAIVFGNTRAMVNRLTTRLSNRGFQVVALSGELSQSERTHALQAMRDGRAQVCVATDVAARGIDLPNLDLVIHAELPNSHETLLHRSGRTGRAGRKGVSALIVVKSTRRKAERILGQAKLDAQWEAAPSAEAVRARDAERMFADPDWEAPAPEADAAVISSLVDRFTPTQIAAGYLRLFHAARTAPEELSDADAKPRPKEAFGPSQWFSLTTGRRDNAEPRRLLPMLCKAGGVTKDDIGAIRIQQDQSFVQIKQTSVEGFLATVGTAMVIEEGIKLAQVHGEPQLDSNPKPYARKGPRTDAPRNDKPRIGKPYAGKPKTGKPKADTPRYDPDQKAPARKPKSTPPIDYDDAPKPRFKKPKPGAPKTAGAKARPPKAAARDYDGAVTDRRPGGAPGQGAGPSDAPKRKPRHKSGASAHSAPASKPPFKTAAKSATKSTGKPGGPPPPKGKPSSKKNRARARAEARAKAAK